MSDPSVQYHGVYKYTFDHTSSIYTFQRSRTHTRQGARATTRGTHEPHGTAPDRPGPPISHAGPAARERASCTAPNSPRPPRTVDRNRSSQPAAPSPTFEASHSGQIGRGWARNAPRSPAGAPTGHSPCNGGSGAPSSATRCEQLPSIGTMTIEGRKATCEARNAFSEWVAGRGVGQSTRTKQASRLRVDGELVVELHGRRYLSTQTEAPSE